MRSFAFRTTTNPFKPHSAWVPGSGLVQIAVSSMLRLDSPPSPQLYLRSTVDMALQIFRQRRLGLRLADLEPDLCAVGSVGNLSMQIPEQWPLLTNLQRRVGCESGKGNANILRSPVNGVHV